MATFKERYEELFGPTPDYDPIDTSALEGTANRRAINIKDAYADASSPQQAIPQLSMPTPRPERQGAFGGLMKAGTATLGEALVGVGEYAARQVTPTHPDQAGYDTMSGIADSLGGVRDVLGDYRQRIYDGMDQDVIDLKGREFTTLDPDKTIWKGSPLEVGEALMYKLVEQIPMTLATLVPGGIMARAGMGAKAITYLGASEAGLSVGFIANDIADGITEMTDAQLLDESDRFGDLVQQYGAVEARRVFTAEAQGMAPVIGGLMVGAVSATAGRFLQPVFEAGGGGVMSRFGRGALSEGLIQEGPQESFEQIATNVARAAYDGDVQALDGVIEAYAQGAAVGGPMGGTFAALAGRGPVDDDGSTPTDRDVPDPPSNQAIDLEAPWELTPREKDMFGEDAIPLDNRDPMAEPVPGALNLTQELLASGVDRDPAVAQSRALQNSQLAGENRPGGARPEGVADGFASHGVHNEVDPLIAAAISANMRTDNQMDELPLEGGATGAQVEYEQFQEQEQLEGNQRLQQSMQGLLGQVQQVQGEPWKPRPAIMDGNAMPTDQPELNMDRPGGSRVAKPIAAATAPMPDELDTPSAEPTRDLKAQLAALDRGERGAVYLSAANLEGLNIDLGDRVVVGDFDGKGGAMVFDDQQSADTAQTWLEQGVPMQEVIGRLTGAGDGKSMSPDAVVVQRLDDEGSVIQESQVNSQQEAERLASEWQQDEVGQRFQTRDGGTGVNTGGNVRILSQEQALARREEEMARESQPDMFAEAPDTTMETQETQERAGDRSATGTGRFRVRFKDDAGATIEDKSFGNKKTAISYANKLVDEYDLVDSDLDIGLVGPVRQGDIRAPMENADARVTVTPIRSLPRQVKTEQVEKTLPREGRAAPKKTAGEKQADKYRKDMSFEERGELTGAVAGAETQEEVTKQLEGAAVRRMRTERKGAIRGFFPPESYEFKDPQHEIEYSNLWDELVAAQDEVTGQTDTDAEIKAEMAMGPILKKMAQLRQIAKPTRIAGKIAAAARRADPTGNVAAAKSTPKFDEMEGVMGESEGELITQSLTKGVEDQLADAEQGRSSALKDEALATRNLVDTVDAIGDLDPNLTREQVDETSGTKLDVMFEQALNYYRGRGKGDKAIDNFRYAPKKNAAGQNLQPVRPDFNTPVTDGPKRKFILRVLAAQANQSESDTRAKGVPLVTKSVQSGALSSSKTRSTEALTARQIKADESRADKIARERKSKKARGGLERAVKAAAARLKKFQSDAGPHKAQRNAVKKAEQRLEELLKVKSTDKRIIGAIADARRAITKAKQALVAANVQRKEDKLLGFDDNETRLYAIRALEAQLQLAQSLLQAWRSDTNMLELADSVTGLLNKTKTKTVNKKKVKVPLEAADLAGWYLTQAHQLPALTGWDKTAGRVEAWNDKLQTASNRTARLERLNKNSIYSTLVAPVLRKLAANTEATIMEPQSSENPTGIPQRVIDKYAELRAEGRSHEGVVDNMADIGKLMPQLPSRDFKALFDQLLIEWRRPSTYKVGYEGKRGGNVDASGKLDAKPTQAEMVGIDWALRQWRDGAVDQKEELYDPVRRILRDFGFEFDSNGNLILETSNGKAVYSEYGGAAQAFQENRLEWEAEAAEAFEDFKAQTLADRDKVEDDQLDANDHVKAAGIFARFRKVVDHSRVTKNAMIDAEFKMLEALDKAGFIANQGSFSATIRIGTFPDITYRKSAYNLRDGRINKEQAHRFMTAIRKSYGVAKAKYAVRAATTAGNITAEENPDIEHGFFIKAVNLPKNSESMRNAANLIGDLLQNNNEVTATQVLRVLASELDPNSIYGIAANKLLYAADFDGVAVKWGDTKKLKELGVFNTGDNTVRINKSKLQANRNSGDTYTEERAVHVVLHEILHSATHNALRTNRALRHSMFAMQGLMQKAFPDSTTYGLKRDLPIDEFVTEMFVNQELQDMAKQTSIAGMIDMNISFMGKVRNMWQHFKMLIVDALGLADPRDSTVFDVVFALEDQLFENAGVWSRDVKKEFNFGGGATLAQTARNVSDRIGLTTQLETRFRNQQSSFGRGVMSLKVTSLDQLLKRYAQYFPENTLTKYVKTFKARNARNAELMEDVEGLSREWTKLHSNDETRENSLRLSQIGTESSLFRVNPTESLSHDSNKHISSMQMRKKHAELTARYQALDPATKALWGSLQKYYKDSLTRETHQMLLNALRGVLTIDNAVFDKKYNIGNIGQFNTVDTIKKEFAEYLPEKRPDIIKTIQRLANVPEMEQGVYFPLMRFGDYAVYANRLAEEKSFADQKDAQKYAAMKQGTDPTLDVSNAHLVDGRWKVTVKEIEFVTAETPAELEQHRRRLQEKYGSDNVGDVTKKIKSDADLAVASNAGLQGLVSALGDNSAAIAAVKNLYLRGLADSSFRKREITRKSRRGVDYDLQHRAFAAYSKQSAYYTAQLEYGWQLADAMREMGQYAKDRRQSDYTGLAGQKTSEELINVFNSIKERDDLSADPQRVGKKTRAALGITQVYMLTSASYHMINSSQPWMVTAPVMSARHKWGPTLSAMKRAQGIIKSPLLSAVKKSGGGFKALWDQNIAEEAFGVFNQLTDSIRKNEGLTASEKKGYLDMLTELRRSHTLEVSPLTELREIAGGIENNAMSRAQDASRIMAHIVEVNNRVLTAMAAYDLELIKSGGDKEAAVKYASEMVSETQFNYSSANKPPLFQSYPLMFQFMQWSQHIYAMTVSNTVAAHRAGWLTKSEARSALFGVLGTHAAVGGLIGVTLQPIKMAIGMLGYAFADDDDPVTFQDAVSGEYYERMIEQGTNSIFGTEISQIMSRGLGMAVGTDLSTRMSFGTLYMVDVDHRTRSSLLGSLVGSFGGAPLNQATQFADSIGKIAGGDWQRGVEGLVPKIARDFLKAGRLLDEGLVNRAGDTVLNTSDMGYWEIALQAMGFAPASSSTYYARSGAMKDVERFVRERKSQLLKDFRTADPADRHRVRAEIRAFNRRYRLEAIDGDSLYSTQQSKKERESQYRRRGVNIDPDKYRQYAEYGEPYE